MIRFLFSHQYNKQLETIEDFIFSSTESLEQVGKFLDEHDRVLKFIEHNPKSSTIHPVTGDQSWVFGDGRYRLFFRVIEDPADTKIYLIHLIDNKQANLDIYPGNSIPTYQED